MHRTIGSAPPAAWRRPRMRSLAKSSRYEEKGEVRWAVYVYNQKDELVASYDLLTMNQP